MKFSDLQLNQKFTIPGYPDIFTKIAHRGGTCCTPEHNATYLKGNNTKGEFLCKADQEVYLYIEPEVDIPAQRAVPKSVAQITAEQKQVVRQLDDIQESKPKVKTTSIREEKKQEEIKRVEFHKIQQRSTNKPGEPFSGRFV